LAPAAGIPAIGAWHRPAQSTQTECADCRRTLLGIVVHIDDLDRADESTERANAKAADTSPQAVPRLRRG
jgi:hypothetical protein